MWSWCSDFVHPRLAVCGGFDGATHPEFLKEQSSASSMANAEMKLLNLSDRERHTLEALKAVAKTAAAHIPGVGEGIAGLDAYQRSKYELYVHNFLMTLHDRVGDLQAFFSDAWLRTADGQLYARKVFACTVNAELEDKHQLFVNALVSGIQEKELPFPQKLKFVDMLRQLSYDALLVLAEMHKRYGKGAYLPGKPDPGIPPPPLTTDQVIDQLKDTFHPYRIESAMAEMGALGLFSRYDAWRDHGDGSLRSLRSVGSKSEGGFYTEFTVRFVEFIETKHDASDHGQL